MITIQSGSFHMKYKDIKREEELKGKVGKDWFNGFDDTRILGNIDFCVSPKKQSNKKEPESLLWAEAKTKEFDTISMFAQLIITIGKERTFDKHLPPAFLGVFDAKKIVFAPYNEVSDLFYLNDFNWNVAPSNHDTKEFRIIKDRIEDILNKNTYVFDFMINETELKFFIKHNLASGSDDAKILIDKNNFVPIYLRWLTQVKPYIDFDWAEGRKQNILDSDFFLADLFVDDKGTISIDDDTPIKDELFVVFKNSHYEIAKEDLKSLFNAIIEIKNKDYYEQFWKKYRREPLKEFQQYIIDRRDLLIPQDVRERKGAFYTPQIWVELSQKYLAEVLGENWQDEYYVWDCAAGTGNLLVGLTNKYNVWASTLDQADVNVMHERINNGANLLHDHVFQFDFLNDDFTKLPQELQNIINDEEKRKKLVMYINPPYAEVGSNIDGVQKNNVQSSKTHDLYMKELGKANRELFAQFFMRIYRELNGSILAEFSKLKLLQAPNFAKFRSVFLASLNKMFVVPANSFDNVSGQFPIGFFIWNTAESASFQRCTASVYNSNGYYIGSKHYYSYDNLSYINDFYRKLSKSKIDNIVLGWLRVNQNDFQSQSTTFIINDTSAKYISTITKDNLKVSVIYFSVKKCIPATWLNDRDQFLYPNDGWKRDIEFQTNCLTFALFSNNIQSKYGTNHWIPFTEQEVNAREKFASNFMTDFIRGKIKQEDENGLFGKESFIPKEPLVFSPEAQAVFEAGKALWTYYHTQLGCNVNASLYDIREHFQGRNDKGKMNNKSDDKHYMELIGNLRSSLKVLADAIAPKVYEYGFLKE
jgi:hypothetical protein